MLSGTELMETEAEEGARNHLVLKFILTPSSLSLLPRHQGALYQGTLLPEVEQAEEEGELCLGGDLSAGVPPLDCSTQL